MLQVVLVVTERKELAAQVKLAELVALDIQAELAELVLVVLVV